MEKKFRSPLTYHELNAELGIKTGQEFDLEKNPSMTKPDEVMTLKDLIKRHYSGQNVPILDQQYNDNLGKFAENAPDISKMSKTEIAHYTQQLESFIKNSYEGIKKYNQRSTKRS